MPKNFAGQRSFTLNGMLVAKSLGNLNPSGNATFKINYITDYYSYPPPHFSQGASFKTGTYREEY